MALLSGPSLRGSVRRTPDHHSDIDGQAPPMKRQRTQLEHRPRRRGSSPDCLTATYDIPPIATKVRPVNPPSKPARPRTSTRRARRQSSSSVDTIASAHQFRTPGHPHVNGNGSLRTPRGPSDRENPSILDHLLDRESPDPLDTISPAPGDSAPKSRPRKSSPVDEPDVQPPKSPATPAPRRRDTVSKTELANLATDDDKPLQVGQPMLRSPTGTRRSQQTRVDDLAENESAPAAGSERRSLRSADSGSRCKSELAQYFYNYEQIISLEDTRPVETLTGSTTIILLGHLSESLPLPPQPDPSPFGNPLLELHDCTTIELPTPALQPAGVDPLGDELYFKAHRKFERQEKQLRNIERDRAQHEKQALDRLLEELRSPEWLRVMGIVGVHESDKKLYEPKRQILIQELVALVNKFQAWKDEEKRRRLLKEKPQAAETEQESRRPRKRSRPAEEAESSPVPGTDTPSTPDPSDVDAWAARQLHQEARSASGAKSNKPASAAQKPKPKPAGPGPAERPASNGQKPPAKQQKTLDAFLSRAKDHSPPSPSPPPVEEPAAPLSEDETPWQAPPPPKPDVDADVQLLDEMPEIGQREYAPPSDLLTEDSIKASRRYQRLLKRRSRG